MKKVVIVLLGIFGLFTSADHASAQLSNLVDVTWVKDIPANHDALETLEVKSTGKTISNRNIEDAALELAFKICDPYLPESVEIVKPCTGSVEQQRRCTVAITCDDGSEESRQR